jgi:hydroxymethylpyrimidine pyrophosphatase-like HAD family hydrolase
MIYQDKLHITCSDTTFLDVMDLNSSKGKALSYIMDMFNISSI